MVTYQEAAPAARAHWAGGGYMIFIQAIASFALRFALAVPFFRSGLVRWNGFLDLSPATSYLYENEYKLNLLAQLGFFKEAPSLPYADILAWALADTSSSSSSVRDLNTDAHRSRARTPSAPPSATASSTAATIRRSRGASSTQC